MSDDSLRIASAVSLVLQLASPDVSLCANGDTGRALPIVASAGIGPTMDVATDGDLLFAVGQGRLSVLDIRQRAAPKLLGALAGLGQVRQVAVHEGVAYVTAREDGLFLIDVSRPDSPQLLSHYDTIELATGHHRRDLPCEEPGDPGYGGGHGLEIFDVTDPGQPQFAGRVKLPPLYRLGYDMWRVTVGERFAFVADTFNGVFVVDVSEPHTPRVVARGHLPHVPERGDPSPAAGVALTASTAPRRSSSPKAICP